ncbi:hypothetical protein DPEC_G00343070 [Dallia pectoralis]|uniref:Uncharacterized protein n=1 Tax=Dallia pectoralis TaxID=75939 RepID=A0ACC2F2T7_DALPE|nr:hypothetical protein DPEC_G00343070 [Dallia pectoralis]
MFGIWAGRRQFRVSLKKDQEGFDGLLHPPAFFNIGGDRGYLFYSGQPPFCRHCRSFGHQAAGCERLKCRNCGEIGHVVAECRAPRFCNGCGAQGHIFKDCPARRRTYADAAGGGDGPGKVDLSLRPLDEVIGEILADVEPPAQPEKVLDLLALEGAGLSTGVWADEMVSGMSDDPALSVGLRRQRSPSAREGGESSLSDGAEPARLVKSRRKKKEGQGLGCIGCSGSLGRGADQGLQPLQCLVPNPGDRFKGT